MTDKLSLPALPEGYRWNIADGKNPETKLKLIRIEHKQSKVVHEPNKMGYWANLFEPWRARPWPSTEKRVDTWVYVSSRRVWPMDPEIGLPFEVEVLVKAQALVEELMKTIENKEKMDSLELAVKEANDA
jgi:hypothetical protein